MVREKPSGANYGIQANIVTSEVAAVGERAHAQKIVLVGTARAEVHTTLDELRLAIRASKMPRTVRRTLESRVKDVEDECRRPRPRKSKIETSLKSAKSTVDGLGQTLLNATELMKSIKRVAQLVGVSLAAIGFN
jgi:hypothetical protein